MARAAEYGEDEDAKPCRKQSTERMGARGQEICDSQRTTCGTWSSGAWGPSVALAHAAVSALEALLAYAV